jgi:hypothetical protein
VYKYSKIAHYAELKGCKVESSATETISSPIRSVVAQYLIEGVIRSNALLRAPIGSTNPFISIRSSLFTVRDLRRVYLIRGVSVTQSDDS